MIRFIVDSTFGVDNEYAAKNKVKVVSLKTILDGVVMDEGAPDTWDEFFARFKASDSFPTTSQPNAEAYKDAIDAIRADEPDADIIILTVGSGLSGTLNSARLSIVDYDQSKIAVIDSENACTASWLMMDEMIAFANEGHSLAETIEYSKDVISRTSVKFVPASMKYLKKGGRIGTLAALFASVIMVKPIFEFKNNKITVPCKVVGFAKAMQEMIKMLPTKIKKLIVCYIGENENIPTLIEKVENTLGIPFEVRPVCPVFGIHVGIGAVGLACIAE